MDWRTRLKELYAERRYIGLTVSGHPLEVMRPWLKARGFSAARDLKTLPPNVPVKLAGEVVIIHTPPQRDASRVIFTTLEDETGVIDTALFPRDQPHNARVIMANPLVLIWGRLSRRERNDTLVTVTRAAPPPLDLQAKNRAAPRGE